jgi:hypothetical protein
LLLALVVAAVVSLYGCGSGSKEDAGNARREKLAPMQVTK